MSQTESLVDAILEGNFANARELFINTMAQRANDRLEAIKDSLCVNEAVRIRRVRVRIRNGKVQRNKKVSAVKGYTMRKGRLTRMSSAERRHRKMGARRAKIKRRSEKSRIRRKLRQSLRRRHSMGLK